MNLIASKNKPTRWRTGHPAQQRSLAIAGSRKTSTWKRLLLVFAFLAGTSPEMTFGQQQQVSSSGDVDAPILTLDDAVTLALQHNWNVKNSVLEAQKQDFELATARSKRKPQFQFSMLGGQLLHSFDFTFQKGAFGTYPSTGPIPATNSKIHTPSVFTTYLTGSIDQPLTQQYKIGLGIHATALGRDIAREEVRAERQKIAAEVRDAYFNLIRDSGKCGRRTGGGQDARRSTTGYASICVGKDRTSRRGIGC